MHRNSSSVDRRRLLAVSLLIPAWLLAPAASGQQGAAGQSLFADVTSETGIDFVHQAGRSQPPLLPEITGGGVALFDLERDGDLDVYFVQSGALDGVQPGDADGLFINQVADEGVLGFSRATLEPDGGGAGYGMAIATGDYNNDGFTDLYIAELGRNRLLRNLDGKGLIDATESAGAAVPGWSTSATFLDFDRDGWLDLYVVNYLTWSLDETVSCFASNSRRDYCGPQSYPPAADRLLRNRGDGTFEPYAVETLAERAAPGLGVVALDANQDGWQDLLVANDGEANQLFINQLGEQEGEPAVGFLEEALIAGVAVNRMGLPEASMGIALSDFDRDGDQDIVISHLSGETNTLYTFEAGFWEDRTLVSGLGPPSLNRTGFGIAWLDVQNDGLLDLVVANGAVREAHQAGGGLGQPNQLFLAKRDGRFSDASASMPASFKASQVSRGLAAGDLDNDGDTDFVVAQSQGPASIYINGAVAASSSVGIEILEANGRYAYGAVARLHCRRGAEEALLGSAVVRTDGSYASASDPRIRFGIDAADCDSMRLQIRWPDGYEEDFTLEPLISRSGGALDFAYRSFQRSEESKVRP